MFNDHFSRRLKNLEARVESLESLALNHIHAKLNHLIHQGEQIMANVEALNAKVDELVTENEAMSAQISEAVVTLAEIKAALDVAGSDQEAVDAAVARIDSVIQALRGSRGQLDTAEEAADITPDA